MTPDPLEPFRQSHVFLGEHHDRNEQRTRWVIALTSVMMVAEIFGGAVFGSMALLADGLHMATHAGAMLIAALAYMYARKYQHDERFAFGTGKLGDLAGFTSAIVLAMIALLIGYESIVRLLHPVAIQFDEALPIAVVGLLVNVVSAWLLKDDHHHHRGHEHHDDHDDDRDDHGHDHDDDHHHGGHAHDINLRAAYVHVLADALVSVLAIVGLFAGRQLGWVWMDPVMGIVGMIVIGLWSYNLIRAASHMLLDVNAESSLGSEITHRLETEGNKIIDLHVWRLGPGHHAAVVGIVCREPCAPSLYKDRLKDVPGLSHITIEVERWPN